MTDPTPTPARSEGSLALVERLAQGDRAALDALLRQHLPGLRGYVRLKLDPLLRAKEQESDIMQSACREILEHLDRFQFPTEGAFRQWLYTTALRKVRNRYKHYLRDKRAADREVPLQAGGQSSPDLVDCYGSLHTPSRELIEREGVDRVEAAFDRLPESYREVLLQVRLLELPRDEVAKSMGKSDTALRTLLCRAQARLMELLADSRE